MLGGTANDHGQLAFVVHVRGVFRSACEGFVTDQSAFAFDKHQGFFRRFESQFFGVISVVQTQSQNGSGLWHGGQGRQPNHLVKLQAFASPRAAREQQLAIGFNGLMHSASPSNACVFHAVAPTK